MCIITIDIGARGLRELKKMLSVSAFSAMLMVVQLLVDIVRLPIGKVSSLLRHVLLVVADDMVLRIETGAASGSSLVLETANCRPTIANSVLMELSVGNWFVMGNLGY